MTDSTSRPSPHAATLRPTDPGQVRTVVLLGSSGSGAADLADSLLRIADGQGDLTRPQARSRSLTSCEVDGVRVVLIDPRGAVDSDVMPDSWMDPRAALRAADAALFVISAIEGLDVPTRLLWQECEAIEMPRAIVVTHVSEVDGDIEEVVLACQEQLGEGMGIHALHLPMLGDDDSVAGLIDLVRLQVTDLSTGVRHVRPAEAQHQDLIEDQRIEMLEAILAESADDSLMSGFIEGDDLDGDLVAAELNAAVARGHLHPVLVASTAPAGLGAVELAELIVQGFPSPMRAHPPMVTSLDGTPRDLLTCSLTGPLCADLVAVIDTADHGRLAVVRLLSGTLRTETPVRLARATPADGLRVTASETGTDTGTDTEVLPDRVRSLLIPVGSGLQMTHEAVAGDIVLVAGLRSACAGDTLSAAEDPLVLEPRSSAQTALAEPAEAPRRDRAAHHQLPIIQLSIGQPPVIDEGREHMD